MQSEIELYFGGEEPYMSLLPVEFATGTELANFAYAEAKKQGAIAVSFGPVIPRDNDGLPV